MFAIATKTFVKEVDNRGLLIPVSSLNDNLELLTVVVKRERSWFWQKPKYLPTDFTLNDLLTGDSPITPGKLIKKILKNTHVVFISIYYSKVTANLEWFICIYSCARYRLH